MYKNRVPNVIVCKEEVSADRQLILCQIDEILNSCGPYLILYRECNHSSPDYWLGSMLLDGSGFIYYKVIYTFLMDYLRNKITLQSVINNNSDYFYLEVHEEDQKITYQLPVTLIQDYTVQGAEITIGSSSDANPKIDDLISRLEGNENLLSRR